MSAALAIVAVPNVPPVRAGRDGVVLTPLRLPNSPGLWLDEWASIARDSGRGDAVSGRFVDDGQQEPGALYLPAISGLGADTRAVVAQYLSWRVLSPSSGQLVDYYA
ncbi:MAG TPA: hypothetical protein VMU24_10555 [Candidatus Acidoferrales bacterium]|nr:hypothetical protein [Candidatus Acidoferrales bacterium]